MSETKAKAIELIKSLPEQTTIDDIISELYLNCKLTQG